jgi:uncharacterized protein YndB with AHSA1/START domain
METKTKRKNVKQEPAVQNELVIHRVFDKSARELWKAWTEPEIFKKWWGPNGFTCPESSMEARKGGHYLNCMRSPDGKEFWSTGEIKEFVPERKLVISDSFADEKGNVIPASEYGMQGDWPSELLITIELEEADGATKMKLTHEGIPPEMHDECMQGWNESFDKLDKI